MLALRMFGRQLPAGWVARGGLGRDHDTDSAPTERKANMAIPSHTEAARRPLTTHRAVSGQDASSNARGREAVYEIRRRETSKGHVLGVMSRDVVA